MVNGPVSIDKETMGGTPVFVGTRVPIQALFDYLESGEDLGEFLENFPSVSRESAVEVLTLASQVLTEQKSINENFA